MTARVRVYVDHAGEYRWRLVSRNGRILACSGEGFTRLRDCYRSLGKVTAMLMLLRCGRRG